MLNAAVLVVIPALALDLLVGDPVSSWHPVAVFGRSMERIVGWAPADPRLQLLFGIGLALGAVAVVGLGSSDLLSLVSGASPLAGVLVGALAFKVSFAYRQLRTEALRIAGALEAGQLEEVRTNLHALVSRETSVLTPAQAASAAIESLAENLCDSVVAPFFYYVLLGVPGALAYRTLNTLDAMIGYHDQFEYLGKAAAKLDDWANWLPARLTTLLLIGGAGLARAAAGNGLRAAWRDHRRTESPNAGWPMATMAGALHVELVKVGQYRLGSPGAEPTPASLRQAVRIADRAAAIAAAALIGASLL